MRYLAPCGTDSAYYRHLRYDEDSCQPCKDAHAAALRLSRIKHPEFAKRQRQWERDNTLRIREGHLYRKYGLTQTAFDEIFELQGRSCACCGRLDIKDSDWCVDHDHDTGKIRGIVCRKCNSGIGQLGDNLDGVTKAFYYLTRCQENGGSDIWSQKLNSTLETFEEVARRIWPELHEGRPPKEEKHPVTGKILDAVNIMKYYTSNLGPVDI